MTAFAYTTVPGKIQVLLDKIREVGPPPNVTGKWLRSIGFTSSNDRTLIRVLQQIGFIDDQSRPTDRWRRFRGSGGPRVLAQAIRAGYAELYTTYPDAHERPTTDLESFFREHTDAGQHVIEKTVSTFKALAARADFSEWETEAAGVGTRTEATPSGEAPASLPVAPAVPFAVNINVQLVLPETADEDVYRGFFAAMREHLLSSSD